MLDLTDRQITVVTVARESRALQGCNPSARSMPGDGQEHIPCYILLPLCSSSGPNAINLLALGKAQSKTSQQDSCLAVGHMRLCRNVVSITYGFVRILDFLDILIELIHIYSCDADDDSISLCFREKTTVLCGFNRQVFQLTCKHQ